MTPLRSTIFTGFALGATLVAFACSDSGSTNPRSGGSGILVTKLTDAPFPSDQVKSVDIYVVRVDARTSEVSDADADQALSDESSSAGGWKTIASPNARFDLLSLQNGNSLVIGQSVLPAGTYGGVRLVIDQSKSSVTLKDGQVLSGGSTPGIKFPSAGQSGLKILLAEPVQIVAGTETELLVDFDVANSFVMRGNTIDKNGLLFKPVVKASVTNLALTNARVRLANATDSSLTLLRSGTALPGASNLAFGASSACNSVNAALPALTVTQGAGNTLLGGFTPTFIPGHPVTFVAYPGATPGAVSFATLVSDYVPTIGQAGFRVFNGTALTAPFDAYITAPAAPLGTATVSNVAAGAASGFVSVPAGASQIRLTANQSTTVLLDFGNQTLDANQLTTLVIAPPATGQTALRAFLVPAC